RTCCPILMVHQDGTERGQGHKWANRVAPTHDVLIGKVIGDFLALPVFFVRFVYPVTLRGCERIAVGPVCNRPFAAWPVTNRPHNLISSQALSRPVGSGDPTYRDIFPAARPKT